MSDSLQSTNFVKLHTYLHVFVNFFQIYIFFDLGREREKSNQFYFICLIWPHHAAYEEILVTCSLHPQWTVLTAGSPGKPPS